MTARTRSVLTWITSLVILVAAVVAGYLFWSAPTMPLHAQAEETTITCVPLGQSSGNAYYDHWIDDLDEIVDTHLMSIGASTGEDADQLRADAERRFIHACDAARENRQTGILLSTAVALGGGLVLVGQRRTGPQVRADDDAAGR